MASLSPLFMVQNAAGVIRPQLVGWRRYAILSIPEKAYAAAKILVAKYGWAYIFLYRYPKGMRTIGALPVGLGSMSWARVTVLNAGSAIVWTVCLVMAGFVFGAQIDEAVETGWGFASVVLLAAMLLLSVFAWWRINRIGVGIPKIGEQSN